MPDDVRNNIEQQRFELDIGGQRSFADYELAKGVITFTHTDVPQVLAGQGVASRLIRGALAQVRTRGLKVASTCPFVSNYLGKHPEYNDLLA